jgi:RNA polymerase-binding transcription factor DksA
MTPSHAQTLALLRRREQELQREIDSAEQRWRDGLAPNPHDVQDFKELAEAGVQAGTRERETERDRQELRDVRAALMRMAEGRYGQCADCGEAIAPARLAAQPQALRCAGCQQRFEQQREQSRGL